MESRLRYRFAEGEKEKAPDVQSSLFQKYTVDKGIDTSRTVNFLVEGHDDAFMDLNHSYIKTTFCVKKDDGTRLGEEPNVFVNPRFGSSLWAQVSISLNNTQLPPGNDYPYTATLIDLLGSSSDYRSYVMTTLSGWGDAMDGNSELSKTNAANIDKASAFTSGKAVVAGSKEIVVYDRIHSDFLMTCSQLLPNRMQLGITLTRSRDSFVLGKFPEERDEYKIEVLSVSLFIKRVILNPAVRQILNTDLATGGKLHYQRLQTITYPCPKDSKTWTWHNCFNGIVPRRVFVAFVSQEAYFGSWNRVGTYLESAGVSRVRFCLDGREVMAEPYETHFVYSEKGAVDVEKTDAKSAYAGLCRVVNSFSSPRATVGLSYGNFIDGSCLFAADLDHADGLGVVSGSLDIHIDFEDLTPAPLMVLVMGEHPKSIAFDVNRQITEL